MAKLRITDDQNTQVVAAIDTHFHDAFLEGTDTPTNATALAAMEKYDEIETADQDKVRVVFRQIVAAVVKVLNIDRPLPVTKFSGTVALRKLTDVTGADGSLTVVDGIITAYTPPT